VKRRLVLEALAIAGAAAAGSSCFDELPEASLCPPPARVTPSGCFSEMPSAFGCLGEEQRACLTVGGCGCSNDSCQSGGDACFPDGDCPLAVREAAGDDASCITLDGTELVTAPQTDPPCSCGCTRCMARCDGVGTVFGLFTNPNDARDDIFAPLVRIGGQVPDRGRIGVYLRLRGVAFLSLSYLKGAPGEATLVPADDEDGIYDGYSLSNPLDDAFVEHTLFDQSFLGGRAYEWQRAEDKPTAVALFAPGANFVLVEIDCIVPFTVP
jgi:hypothetical protein